MFMYDQDSHKDSPLWGFQEEKKEIISNEENVLLYEKLVPLKGTDLEIVTQTWCNRETYVGVKTGITYVSQSCFCIVIFPIQEEGKFITAGIAGLAGVKVFLEKCTEETRSFIISMLEVWGQENFPKFNPVKKYKRGVELEIPYGYQKKYFKNYENFFFKKIL